MSAVNKDTVKAVAEEHGFADLKDECASILSADLEYRLREIVQPIFGYTSAPIPGFDKDERTFRSVNMSGTDVYYIPERVVPLSDILSAPLPKCPAELRYTSHWLAIDGVQPAIPQNPSVATPAAAAPAPSQPSQAQATASATISGSDAPVSVKPLVKHSLSKELQLYYENATHGILDDQEKEEYRKQVLTGLQEDPGLHQLVPYFAQFIQEKITTNLKKPALLLRLIAMTDSLLRNTHLFITPYLHQLIPALLSCVVAKRLFDTNAPEADVSLHWTVRDSAAAVVGNICKQYSNSYNDLQARVTNTYVGALLNEKLPLTTHYGAIVGLTRLGARSIDVFILGNLKAYKAIFDSLKAAHESDAQHVLDALWASNRAMQNAVAAQLRGKATPASDAAAADPAAGERYQLLRDLFGNRMDTLGGAMATL